MRPATGSRVHRLIPLAILIILLIPGHWLRNTTPPSHEGETTAAEIAFTASGEPQSPITLKRVWQITGPNATVGGYSALIVQEGSLVSYSDIGTALPIDVSKDSVPSPRDPQVVSKDLSIPKWDRDIEAATQDAETGDIWLAYESSNSIKRFQENMKPTRWLAPTAMSDWGDNSGPEAMTRLSDGRFIVLREGWVQSSSTLRPGLLFDGDPTDKDAKITPFTIELPDGYSPTDMAQLPDGRVLILLRAIDWGLPPRFEAKLIIAKPETISKGKKWGWEATDFAMPRDLRENYEGLAIGEPREDGSFPIWMISDNNFAAYQRSLLLELEWRAGADKDADKGEKRANEKGAPAP